MFITCVSRYRAREQVDDRLQGCHRDRHREDAHNTSHPPRARPQLLRLLLRDHEPARRGLRPGKEGKYPPISLVVFNSQNIPFAPKELTKKRSKC